MIEEEENCKERLIKMIDALNKIDVRDYFRYPYLDKKMPVEDFKKLGEGEYSFESGVPKNEDYVRYRIFNKIIEPFNNITEETACFILEKLKEQTTGDFSLAYSNSDKDYYRLDLVINPATLPKPFKIFEGGGIFVFYMTIDLLQHFDHFDYEVCEIDRLEGDISRIFANA